MPGTKSNRNNHFSNKNVLQKSENVQRINEIVRIGRQKEKRKKMI